MQGFRGLHWRRHRALTVALVLASLLALLFGLRLAHSAIHWSDRRDAPIAGWMTLGFISRSWDVDRDTLADALGVEAPPGKRLTLEAIAARTGKPLAEVKATVERTLQAEDPGPGGAR